MSIRVGAALVFGLVLALGPVMARPDMGPEEELFGDEISGTVEITGLSRFPEHVFYAFPLRCSRALVGLEEGGEDLGLDDLKVVDGVDDQANFAVLQDGPIADWIGAGGPCQATSLYAMGREAAAGVDLAAMPLAALQTFFAEDPRLFRSDFKLLDNPPYASTGSPLRSVDEVVRVLRIEAQALVVVLDEATYSFADGTVQTLKLAHTRRPELPFRPLKPAKVEKYASSYAKWEARQPLEPPPAPKLPVDEYEVGAEVPGGRGAGCGGAGCGGAGCGGAGCGVRRLWVRRLWPRRLWQRRSWWWRRWKKRMRWKPRRRGRFCVGRGRWGSRWSWGWAPRSRCVGVRAGEVCTLFPAAPRRRADIVDRRVVANERSYRGLACVAPGAFARGRAEVAAQALRGACKRGVGALADVMVGPRPDVPPRLRPPWACSAWVMGIRR
jgi:hypothetical protein